MIHPHYDEDSSPHLEITGVATHGNVVDEIQAQISSLQQKYVPLTGHLDSKIPFQEFDHLVATKYSERGSFELQREQYISSIEDSRLSPTLTLKPKPEYRPRAKKARYFGRSKSNTKKPYSSTRYHMRDGEISKSTRKPPLPPVRSKSRSVSTSILKTSRNRQASKPQLFVSGHSHVYEQKAPLKPLKSKSSHRECSLTVTRHYLIPYCPIENEGDDSNIKKLFPGVFWYNSPWLEKSDSESKIDAEQEKSGSKTKKSKQKKSSSASRIRKYNRHPCFSLTSSSEKDISNYKSTLALSSDYIFHTSGSSYPDFSHELISRGWSKFNKKDYVGALSKVLGPSKAQAFVAPLRPFHMLFRVRCTIEEEYDEGVVLNHIKHIGQVATKEGLTKNMVEYSREGGDDVDDVFPLSFCLAQEEERRRFERAYLYNIPIVVVKRYLVWYYMDKYSSVNDIPKIEYEKLNSLNMINVLKRKYASLEEKEKDEYQTDIDQDSSSAHSFPPFLSHFFLKKCVSILEQIHAFHNGELLDSTGRIKAGKSDWMILLGGWTSLIAKEELREKEKTGDGKKKRGDKQGCSSDDHSDGSKDDLDDFDDEEDEKAETSQVGTQKSSEKSSKKKPTKSGKSKKKKSKKSHCNPAKERPFNEIPIYFTSFGEELCQCDIIRFFDKMASLASPSSSSSDETAESSSPGPEDKDITSFSHSDRRQDVISESEIPPILPDDGSSALSSHRKKHYKTKIQEIKSHSLLLDMIFKLNNHISQLSLLEESNAWVIKPPSLSRGRGIRVSNNIFDILIQNNSEERGIVLQKYIENTLTVFNYKFDMRQWVLLLSVNPLIAYFYDTNYIRFASQEYSHSNLFDKFAHLTNYSVQKYCDGFGTNEQLGEGNMIEFPELLDILRQKEELECGGSDGKCENHSFGEETTKTKT
ncbi:Tubulin-tyrosine ligase/Tubulin polyglutamylase like protein, partial [Aduncisulcus paluster]